MLNMELPEEVAKAARMGDIDPVKAWLAAGGSPHVIKLNGEAAGTTLLANACMTCRPACAPVAELLCAAGARDDYDAPRGNTCCAGPTPVARA